MGGKLAGVTFVVATAILLGCDIPPRPTLSPVTPTASKGASPTEGEPAADGLASVNAENTWSLFVRGETPVGYRNVRVSDEGAAPGMIATEIEESFDVRHGRATIRRSLGLRISEASGGGLRGIESVARLGPAVTRVRGDVRDGAWSIETIRGMRVDRRRVPWEPTHGGPLAIDRSLRASPMKPGDRRTIRMFDPAPARVIDVRLRCVGEAAVPLLDGSSPSLFEIDRTDLVDGEVVGESVLWSDDSGSVQRWLSADRDVVGYRSSEAEVSQAFGGGRPEDEPTAWLAAGGESTLPERPELTLFAVRFVAPTDPATATITALPGQWIKRVDGRTVHVLANRLTDQPVKGFERDRQTFTESDLSPSRVVDFRAPAVQDLVKRTGPMLRASEARAAGVATELTALAHRLTSVDPSGSGIVAASAVAKRAKGDALGQAILLTAFLRSAKIPARVAVGLRHHSGDEPAMRFHAWTIAWHTDRWHAYDATTGRDAVADRITLATMDFADGTEPDAHQQLIEIVSRIGEFEIDVVRSRPESKRDE